VDFFVYVLRILFVGDDQEVADYVSRGPEKRTTEQVLTLAKPKQIQVSIDIADEPTIVQGDEQALSAIPGSA